MRRRILTYCFYVVMLLASVPVFAKKKGPPPPQNQPPPPGLPIDGGISYLFIAGAAYGIYAIRKKFTLDD
ncbi:MAG: hypothetical protein Q7J19_06410 [Lutibacter sp.]|nr:hypothetical protein [Lutibacter sp.]